MKVFPEFDLQSYNGILSENASSSGAHLGISEGSGQNFRKGGNQYKTKKKRI